VIVGVPYFAVIGTRKPQDWFVLPTVSKCEVLGVYVWPEKTRFARLSDNRAFSVAKPQVYFISTNHFLHIATPEKIEQYDHLRSTWINSPKIIVMICFCLYPTQPWFLDVSARCSWDFYCWWLGPRPCGDPHFRWDRRRLEARVLTNIWLEEMESDWSFLSEETSI